MGKQDKQLLKNIEEYEQKKKAEQQKSKILGQKPVKRKTNKEKSTVQTVKGCKIHGVWYE